jgi:hypothetical protein
LTSGSKLTNKKMANSKLLKEAIADAKAVKETALANAKIALEEAFTPRLQSILSKKLREEEGAEEGEDVNEELTSSEIGSGNEKTPKANKPLKSDTDLSVGVKKSSAAPANAVTDYTKSKDINEGEEGEEVDENLSVRQLREKLLARLAELDGEEAEEEGAAMPAPAMGEDEPEAGEEEMPEMPAMGEDEPEAGEEEMPEMPAMGEDEPEEDGLDLEAIIRELESELEAPEGEDDLEDEDEDEDLEETYTDGAEAGTDKGEDPKVVKAESGDPTKASGKGPRGSFDIEEGEEKGETDEVVDLEEILREMEADLKEGGEEAEEEPVAEVKKQLKEAYSTIQSLRKTLNEVNLLNAKLLFANKLFRAHNMTNEQKVKIIETLDRTKSVREVKLVYSTLAENLRYGGNKAVKKSITEGIASKVVKSTKPAAEKQVISEGADFAARFKKLAGIIK